MSHIFNDEGYWWLIINYLFLNRMISEQLAQVKSSEWLLAIIFLTSSLLIFSEEILSSFVFSSETSISGYLHKSFSCLERIRKTWSKPQLPRNSWFNFNFSRHSNLYKKVFLHSFKSILSQIKHFLCCFNWNVIIFMKLFSFWNGIS